MLHQQLKNINSAYCASVQRDKAVVVAQLVDQGVLTPEVRGSNPAISKICTEQLYTVKTLLKRRKLKKRPGISVTSKKSPNVYKNAPK